MRSLVRVLALAVVPLLFAPSAQAHFERGELEQMLAPIALYPDTVLSHVLIAATYPDQVEAAARWSRRHPTLHGEDAVDAVEAYDWDPSVKALVAFPEVLARMDEDPDWTERLGEAFLHQEAEVMDSVQTLRDHAYDSGRLGSLEHVRVVREREYIYIEPAVRHIVYVPYYDPWYVYGNWWWPSYPPYTWRTWGGHPASYYRSGFYWGVGFRIAPTFYFTTFYWPERYVVVTHRHHDNWRPIYSGRDVPRHREVRHWREDRRDRHGASAGSSRGGGAWANRPSRPEQGRPEHRRPDTGRPENGRPDNGRPEHRRPKQERPEQQRPAYRSEQPQTDRGRGAREQRAAERDPRSHERGSSRSAWSRESDAPPRRGAAAPGRESRNDDDGRGQGQPARREQPVHEERRQQPVHQERRPEASHNGGGRGQDNNRDGSQRREGRRQEAPEDRGDGKEGQGRGRSRPQRD